MKTIITTILFLALAVPAWAGNPYVALRGVGVRSLDRLEPGGEAAIGYRLNDYFRAEACAAFFEGIDFEYTQAVPDKRLDPIEINGLANAQIYTVRGILDIPTGTDLTPYVVAGAGFVNLAVEMTGSTTVRPFPGLAIPLSESTSWEQTNRVLTAGVGCSYRVAEKLFLEASVMYYNMGKIDLDELAYQGQNLGLDKEPLQTYIVGAGVRYEFDWPW